MHVPCNECGSSDAGWIYPAGDIHCFKCGHNTPADGEQEQPVTTKAAKGKAKFLNVTFQSLSSRGLREDTCQKWGYGVALNKDDQPVHVAQFYDAKGKLCGQKVRGKDKKFCVIGDLKPAGLYGQWIWRDSGKMVVITEGELDALSVSQAQDNKWPVVSVPQGAQSAAKAIAASVEWLEQFDKVVLMLDMDEPGQEAALECAEVLSPGKAYIARLPLKDANEMLVAGRSKELIDAIWAAKVYRPDGVVSGDEVWEQIIREDLAQGREWNHRGLQAKTRGLRRGELVTVVAGTGAGKSTFCRELAMHLILAGERVGYIALEEDVRRSALGLLSILQDRPLHFFRNAEIVTPELKAAWESIKDRAVFYDHFGSLDSENLLSKIRYMVKALGTNFVFLDHLSIVVSGMDVEADERRTLDSTMTKLASLAQEMNCCIILVSHLRRSEGKPHEEGKAVCLSDLRGSHSIAQLSHTVVAIERDQQGEDSLLSTIRLLKCRHTGGSGDVGCMRYDEETGRLREYITEFDDAAESPKNTGAARVLVPDRQAEGSTHDTTGRTNTRGAVHPGLPPAAGASRKAQAHPEGGPRGSKASPTALPNAY